MKIHPIAIFVTAALFSYCSVQGQTPSPHIADSILLLGELNPVDSLLKQTETEITSNPRDSGFLKELLEYRTLFDDLVQYVAHCAQATPEALFDITDEGRKSAHLYTEARAGDLAPEAYARFEALSQSGPSVEAAKFLRIARMFKILHTDRTLAATRRLLAQARQSLNDNNLNYAATVLDSITWNPEHRQIAPGLADSLNLLSEKVNRALGRIEQRKYLWERHEVVSRTYTFSLVTHVGIQEAGDPMPLSIHNDTSSLQVNLIEQETHFPFSGGIQLWRSLSEKLQVGATLYTVSYRFTSNLDPQSFSTDFKVRHWCASVGGRYLFRSTVGLRPYVDLNLGVRHYSQKEAECIVLAQPADTTLAVVRNRYVLDVRSGSVGIAISSLGVQFVPTQTNRFGISSEVTLFYNMKTNDLVERTYLTFGLHFDLLL